MGFGLRVWGLKGTNVQGWRGKGEPVFLEENRYFFRVHGIEGVRPPPADASKAQALNPEP